MTTTSRRNKEQEQRRRQILWKGQRFGHWEKGFPANQSLKQQRNMRTGIDLTEKWDRRKWENKLLTMIITLENMAGRNREDVENDVSLELQCLKPPAHFCLIKRHFVSNTSSLDLKFLSSHFHPLGFATKRARRKLKVVGGSVEARSSSVKIFKIHLCVAFAHTQLCAALAHSLCSRKLL